MSNEITKMCWEKYTDLKIGMKVLQIYKQN